jgi:hypothetical protein
MWTVIRFLIMHISTFPVTSINGQTFTRSAQNTETAVVDLRTYARLDLSACINGRSDVVAKAMTWHPCP